ncbi:hypothetical protein F4779DRAFT_257688 [Xylariaceae sp. FL0662B]|nr:hypothetical protein F4779DRAFT_257688 [Xylariaceae sp. FL0662B]
MGRRRAKAKSKPGDRPLNAALIPGYYPADYVPPQVPVRNIPTDPRFRFEKLKQIVQQNGSWFIRGLDLGSRYYRRQPGDDMARSNAQNDDPVDILLMVKDVNRLSRNQLVARLVEDIQNAGEYSYDFDQERQGHRRLHTNGQGSEFLHDFDALIEMLDSFRREFNDTERAGAAATLFRELVQRRNYDTSEIAASGFEDEWLRYVSSWFLARLRFMNQYGIRDREFIRLRNQQSWDVNTERLIMNEMNHRLHGPSLREDLRAIEWFTHWTSVFNRYEREVDNRHPRLNPDSGLLLFQHTYGVTYENALKLASNAIFSVDISIIDDWIEYKDKGESLFKNSQRMIENIQRCHQERFVPWVESLQDCVRRWDGGADLSTFPMEQYEGTHQARQDFTEFVDENAKNIYSGRGRWCQSAPPRPGLSIGYVEKKDGAEKRWGEGWYCVQHRPGNQCMSCGWEFRCAMCSNPHTCVNCQTPYHCAECGVASYDPDRDDAVYTYQVEGAALFPGLLEDGVAIRPRRYVTPLNQTQFGPVPVGGFAGTRAAPPPGDPNNQANNANNNNNQPPPPPRPVAPVTPVNVTPAGDAMDIDVSPQRPEPQAVQGDDGGGWNVAGARQNNNRGAAQPQQQQQPQNNWNQNQNRGGGRGRRGWRGRGGGGGRVGRGRPRFVGPAEYDYGGDDDTEERLASSILLEPRVDPAGRVAKARAKKTVVVPRDGRDWRRSDEALQRAVEAGVRRAEEEELRRAEERVLAKMERRGGVMGWLVRWVNGEE